MWPYLLNLWNSIKFSMKVSVKISMKFSRKQNFMILCINASNARTFSMCTYMSNYREICIQWCLAGTSHWNRHSAVTGEHQVRACKANSCRAVDEHRGWPRSIRSPAVTVWLYGGTYHSRLASRMRLASFPKFNEVHLVCNLYLISKFTMESL